MNWSNKFILILGVIWCVSSLYSQTGKVVGRVVDAETGNPLPAANVIVVNTSYGAATDIDGYFLILNIPPGTYTLRASMIGYSPTIIEGVKVSIDHTTEVNFSLKPTTITTKPVVVKAREPLVKKDVTSSEIVVHSEEIRSLPVESVQEIVTNYAGVNRGPGGELHIRGGRSSEIAYYIDGIPVTDPYLGSQGVYVPTNVVRQLELIAGSYNAEYGSAMSGVINIVTEEGSRKFHGNISIYSGDKVSNHGDYFPNIEKVDPLSSIDLRYSLSGPLTRALTYSIGGRVLKDKGWLYGKNIYMPYDTRQDTANPHGDSSLVALNPTNIYQSTAKLTWQPSGQIKIQGTGIYSYSHYKSYGSVSNHLYLYTPLSNPHQISRSYSGILGFQWLPTNRFSASLKLGYTHSSFKQFVYEDYYSLGYLFPVWEYTLSKGTFYRGGVSRYWYDRYTNSEVFKLDMTYQWRREHLFKWGVEAIKYTLHRFSMNVDNPDTTPPALPILDTIYDVDQYTHYPSQYSAYIQDKMEYKDVIVNAGIRLDYFNPNWKTWVNDSAPSPMIWNRTDRPFPGYRKVDPKWQVSPRIGIAFPVSEQGVFHFSYGQFFQTPPFYYLYRNSDFEWAQKANQSWFGNADLKPQQTASYEVGYKQGYGQNLSFEITAFYKDIRNLLATKMLPSVVPGDHYVTYINKDYGNVRGVTFQLRFRNIGNISGEIAYTLQVAEGINSGPRDLFADLRRGVETPKKLVPLNWDERHTINGILTYRPTQRFSITTVAAFGSGQPYTPADPTGAFKGEENSARKPPRFNVDLYAQYGFRLLGGIAKFFVKIYNVFDIMNERIVWSDTGRATYTNRTILTPLADPLFYKRPYFFSTPRTIKVGLELNM